MRHDEIKPRITDLDFVASGDCFEGHRVATSLRLSLGHVLQVLREMVEDGTVEEVTPRIFRQRSMAKHYITQPWGGRAGPDHFGSREWV